MKIRKMVLVLLISFGMLSTNVYAKYTYYFDETIVKMTRDSNAPVCHIEYSTKEWTNQNVIVTITSNKEIEQVSGFELSEDKKVLTKEVSENEYGVIKVRDYSGNETEVEYNVSNIDKEPPQIIGCENGGIYQKPISLDYKDNVEIKDIFVNRYDDELSIQYCFVYYDCYFYYGIDRTQSTLSLNVTGHPKNTKKYKYYANNQLFATTTETSYTYTGLQKGTSYELKVQAIDAFGNVLDEKMQTANTSYFTSIVSNKTSNEFSATIQNLDSSIKKIRYAVWNYSDEDDIRWYDTVINNHTAVVNCVPFKPNYYDSYVIHAYLYDENDNLLDALGFSVDFHTNYIPRNPSTIDPYQLTQSGNYQIKVSDLAGNEIIYEIKVK